MGSNGSPERLGGKKADEVRAFIKLLAQKAALEAKLRPINEGIEIGKDAVAAILTKCAGTQAVIDTNLVRYMGYANTRTSYKGVVDHALDLLDGDDRDTLRCTIEENTKTTSVHKFKVEPYEPSVLKEASARRSRSLRVKGQ